MFIVAAIERANERPNAMKNNEVFIFLGKDLGNRQLFGFFFNELRTSRNFLNVWTQKASCYGLLLAFHSAVSRFSDKSKSLWPSIGLSLRSEPLQRQKQNREELSDCQSCFTVHGTERVQTGPELDHIVHK